MMRTNLCITARFLQALSHGRGADGEPEWPPSPLRMYQALIAAAAGRWNERVRLEFAAGAFDWLERQAAPQIIAPAARLAREKYRLYVPDNVGDKVAASWSRGRTADIADYRTEKDVQPVNLADEAVHFVYPIADDGDDAHAHFQTLAATARSLTHLGWGVDMVVGNATVLSDDEVRNLPGERWLPVDAPTNVQLRVPVQGTLAALQRRHIQFLNRLGPDGFTPVSPLSACRLVGYRRSTEPAGRAWAAFGLLRLDASGFRPFNTAGNSRAVAGMLRNLCASRAHRHGWPRARINTFVHGKSPDGSRPASGAQSPDRFAYLPLPTISRYGGRADGSQRTVRIDAIRRVLVAAPPHCRREIEWARRLLAGEVLIAEDGSEAAVLAALPGADWVLKQYLDASQTWSTVTPVILPRHDGYRPDQAGPLLRLAFEQAGYSPELLDQSEFEWRSVGFLPGADLASRYLPPANLSHKPRYHVRVRFPHAIQGPVVAGSGRFRGFGLFVHNE